MILRYILLVIGVLIILGIAFDGWRRKRRRLRMNAQETIEPKVPTPKRIPESEELPTIEEMVETTQPMVQEITDTEAEPDLEKEQVIAVANTKTSSSRSVQVNHELYNLEIETVSAPVSANQKVTQEGISHPKTIFSANEKIPAAKPKVQESHKTIVETAEVITLTVMSINSRPFTGYDLLKALEENHLHYGEFGIYHRHKYKNGKGPLYFSVASVVKPGTLDPKSIGTLSTPGLALFMQLNNRKHDRIVFKQILATAHQLAKTLGGVVCDNKRVPLREATLQSYAEKIDL